MGYNSRTRHQQVRAVQLWDNSEFSPFQNVAWSASDSVDTQIVHGGETQSLLCEWQGHCGFSAYTIKRNEQCRKGGTYQLIWTSMSVPCEQAGSSHWTLLAIWPAGDNDKPVNYNNLLSDTCLWEADQPLRLLWSSCCGSETPLLSARKKNHTFCCTSQRGRIELLQVPEIY